MNYTIPLTILLLSATPLLAQSPLEEAMAGITHQGELRFGAIGTEDALGTTATTLSLGGRLSLETKPLNGVSLVGTFFTTTPLFGEDEEGLFLDSTNRGYAIVGESYLKALWSATTLKVGRQLIDTPFADSDDIAMIPNTFEALSVVSKELPDTTLSLALLTQMAGVDAPIAQRFSKLQPSADPVVVAGVEYEGIAHTNLALWYYGIDAGDILYAEGSYEMAGVTVGVQYADQDHDNTAYGALVEAEISDFTLGVAYNKAEGIVSNGFGGGAFFTSSEDHTIAAVRDQEALRYRAAYALGSFEVGVAHLALDKGEDETDYLLHYAVNKNHTLDIIYSEMYDDGNMVRFFANYSF